MAPSKALSACVRYHSQTWLEQELGCYSWRLMRSQRNGGRKDGCFRKVHCTIHSGIQSALVWRLWGSWKSIFPRSAPETYSNPYPVVSISLRELGGAFKVTSQCFNWQSKLEAEFCISVTRSASGRIMLEAADSSLSLWHPFFTTRAKLGVTGSNGEPKRFPHHSLR